MAETLYDRPEFFEKYSQMSRSTDGLAGAGEWHVLRQMLPALGGKRVLDLGCGFGWHCIYAAEQGARSVVGIDCSEKMLERARRMTAFPQVEYACLSIEDAAFPPDSFDVVFSSLALHYVEGFRAVCEKAALCLSDGGAFVFSVEHPVFTASGSQEWCTDSQGNKLHWPVDRYFEEGWRSANFLGEEVRKHHKTLTTYLRALLETGFMLTDLREPEPSPALLEKHPDWKDELRRPMMLLIAARKTAGR